MLVPPVIGSVVVCQAIVIWSEVTTLAPILLLFLRLISLHFSLILTDPISPSLFLCPYHILASLRFLSPVQWARTISI